MKSEHKFGALMHIIDHLGFIVLSNVLYVGEICLQFIVFSA